MGNIYEARDDKVFNSGNFFVGPGNRMNSKSTKENFYKDACTFKPVLTFSEVLRKRWGSTISGYDSGTRKAQDVSTTVMAAPCESESEDEKLATLCGTSHSEGMEVMAALGESVSLDAEVASWRGMAEFGGAAAALRGENESEGAEAAFHGVIESESAAATALRGEFESEGAAATALRGEIESVGAAATALRGKIESEGAFAASRGAIVVGREAAAAFEGVAKTRPGTAGDRCPHGVCNNGVERALDSECHVEHLPSSVFSRSRGGPFSCRGRGARWSGVGPVARRACRSSALCPCCGLDLVGGNDNICGECLSRAFGYGPWNSCVGHGKGQGAGHVQEAAGGTKLQSTRTRSGVWRPLDGTLSVGDELTLIHRGASEETGVGRPLEGLVSVGEELTSDFRGASEEVHVEAREGDTSTTRCGTRLVELGQGCEVEVKIPSDPERDPRSPGPGIRLRERWRWKPLLRTLTSGIWVLPGALVSEGFGRLLEAACSWERRGTYRTAWAVCPWSGCQCSYSYGQGPAIGPHTGRGCFRHLSNVWRAIAPLLSPWCAEGDVPSAANLNLYGGSRSHVSWHCDDEPLFGGSGDPKLIVSLSLGSPATFKWKAKSCSDSEVSSCRLHHGDLLVMDGRCQDEYLHCTSPGLADRRVNITYRFDSEPHS